LLQNSIRETRGAAQRIGIRLGKETKEIAVIDNTFSGLKLDFAQL